MRCVTFVLFTLFHLNLLDVCLKRKRKKRSVLDATSGSGVYRRWALGHSPTLLFLTGSFVIGSLSSSESRRDAKIFIPTGCDVVFQA